MPKLIPIETIKLIPAHRGRDETGFDPKWVATLKAVLDEGGKLDPVTLWEIEGRGIYPEDGWYRIEAHRQCGRTQVMANVRRGTWDDFVGGLISSNADARCRPLCDNDKRTRVLIAIFNLPAWTDARIAKATNVSRDLVARMRSEHDEAARSVNGQHVDRHVDGETNDGKRLGSDDRWRGPRHQAPQATGQATVPPLPFIPGSATHYVPLQEPRVKPTLRVVAGIPDPAPVMEMLTELVNDTFAAIGALDTPTHERWLRAVADFRHGLSEAVRLRA